jgi:acetyl esterase/lipase
MRTTLRRLLPAVLSLALVAGALASCDWPDGTRYAKPVFTEVERTRGIVYRTTTTWDGRPIKLRLDLYRPVGDTETNRPTVVWLFGGGWLQGDRDQLRVYAEDSARRGYVGVTIDYRIRPDQEPFDFVGAALDAYDDTIAAVQFLQDHAAEYGINPDQIITAGHSSGGINALHTAYMPGTRGPATSPVAAAIGISALSFAAPAPGAPPTAQFHGTADDVVPFVSGQDTCNRSIAAGNFCVMFPYEGADHSLPHDPRYQADIMTKIADFIYEQVILPDQRGE